MGSAVWVMVVLAAVLVLVALVVFVAPLARSGSDNRADGAAAASRPAGSSGPLARGFGYLRLSPGPQARRGGVHARMARAFARIDVVDPHAAPRRIGEALAQAGLAEPPRRATAAEPSTDLGWRSRSAEQPRDVG